MPSFPSVGDPGTDVVAPPDDWASNLLEALAVSLASDGTLQPAVAGSGLSIAGGVLAVGVDGSTVEISADALRIKDLGVTSGKLASGAAAANLANGTITGTLTLTSTLAASAAILGTNPAAAGTLRLPNAGWIASRNAANGADVNMLRLSSSDLIEVGSSEVVVNPASQPTTNLGALSMSKAFANVAGSGTAIVNLYSSSKGIVSAGVRSNGIYVAMQDAAAVANRTITGMSRSGTTVTVTATAHGFVNGDKINIYGVTHTFDAQVNASWTIANVAANTFDITVAGLSSGTYTSGGTATNRPMMYGVSVSVLPGVDRGTGPLSAANADDVNCYVGYNAGPGVATDCYYVGRDATAFPSSPEWQACYTADAYVAYGIFKSSGRAASGAAVFRAQDATIDSGGYLLTGPNSGIYAQKNNAGSALVNMFKLNTSDQMQIDAPIRVPYATAIVGRNSADSGDINMIAVTDASGRIRIRDNIFFSASKVTWNDPYDMDFGTTTGTKFGTSTAMKMGFYNATPIAQRAGAAQAAVATTGSTQTTPYGFTTAAQADAIVTLVNELRAWAVAQGFIKGAA